MCKFCKGEETIGKEGQKVFLNENSQLVYLGKRSIFGELIGSINYCPICGKKLKDK